MLFCAFQVPEPSSTSANMAQNSIPANAGHVPAGTPAARELQTAQGHKRERKGEGKRPALQQQRGLGSDGTQLNVWLLSRPQTGLLKGRMSLLTPVSSARHHMVRAPQQKQRDVEGK